MNTLDCIKTRRSVRKYADKPVPHELIEQAIAAAAYAPSWKNTQVTRYYVVDDPELKAKIADECCGHLFPNNAKIIENAPMVIATAMVRNRSGYERDGSFTNEKEKGWQMFDCGIASQTFALACHEMGVDTVIMGIFDFDRATELFQIPEDQEVAALMAVGYREDEEIVAPKRKTVEQLLTFVK